MKLPENFFIKLLLLIVLAMQFYNLPVEKQKEIIRVGISSVNLDSLGKQLVVDITKIESDSVVYNAKDSVAVVVDTVKVDTSK